jgi:hypothetical protein
MMKRMILTGTVVLASLLTTAALLATERPDRPNKGTRGDVRHGDKAGRRGWGRRQLTDEQKAKAIEFAKTHSPELYQSLMKVKESKPEEYQRMVRGVYYRYRSLMHLPAETREMYMRYGKLRTQVYQARKKYHAATTDADRQQCKESLQKLLADSFDTQQSMRVHKLEQMEKQLAALREELKDNKANRDKILAERLERYCTKKSK